MPLTSKKRKQKAPFCLSFSRRLDRFHESPGVYDSTRRQPLPFMLRLPAELRQQILDIVLDDDDVLFPRPNSRTQALALTCKTFAMDVREVMKLWEVREGVLRSQLGTDRSSRGSEQLYAGSTRAAEECFDGIWLSVSCKGQKRCETDEEDRQETAEAEDGKGEGSLSIALG
ncbi:hypothetical protein Slin14017_G026690 [Septoria linicola]|nr:hypothetical protein Slin14017_G026690 [Septoria linicola]